MSNPFFNNAISLTPGTKARAPDVEDKFNMVGGGFDAVNLAILAAYAGPGTQGTSTTSLTVSNGTKNFFTQPGLSFLVGLEIKLASAASISNYMTGPITAYNSVTGATTAQINGYGGSGTFADWSVFAYKDTRTLIGYILRTGNISLSLTENSYYIDVIVNSFTQTFDPCAVLGNRWWCIFGNSGTGEVTLKPNGSETIDGVASYIMYPGEVRMVICDGITLRTIILKSFSTSYSTGVSSFSKPPGYTHFGGIAWGGGGSGGKSGTANNTGGGGGAAGLTFTVLASSLPTTATVTVGAGGAAVTVAGPGNSGGSTQLGSAVYAFGGGGGGGNSGASHTGGSGGGILSVGNVGGASPVAGGAPAILDTTLSYRDNPGFGGGTAGTNYAGNSAYGGGAGGWGAGGAGGSSVYGGGGGGGGGPAPNPGNSIFGGAGGAGSDAGNGTVGVTPGGGGGGTRTGTATGAGGAGQLRIWGIA